MVCDIGGGTVDITAIRHCEDNFEVIIPPMGNDSGGKGLNEEFSNFLGKIVQDPKFTKFLQVPGKEAGHKAILSDIVDRKFESEKLIFGDQEPNAEGSICLLLDTEFVDFYRQAISEGIENCKDPRITFDGESILEIQYTKVVDLFQPLMADVTKCVLDALHKVQEKIDLIYLVGGFGGCWFTFSTLKSELCSYNIPIVVPKDYKLAVSRGAVTFRRNPECIRARTMEASYGISCGVTFQEGIHDEYYAYRDPEDNTKKCGDIFFVFVRKGDKVAITDRFEDILIPYSSESTIATFVVYCTKDRTIQYIKDKHRNMTVEEIGSLTLKIPNPENLQKSKRDMKVAMDFSHTEIKVQAQATYLPNEPSVEVVLDFL